VLENPKKPELELEYFDLSRDEEIQDQLFKFTKFFDIPQFYCDGKLIGGYEMLQELHTSKQLLPILLGFGKRENPDDYLRDKVEKKKSGHSKKVSKKISEV